MSNPTRTRITAMLSSVDAAAGPSTPEELLPLVYQELKEMAARLMHRERRDHTLQPTALVHEAYLRLVDQTRVKWQGVTHFRAVATQAMRRILIDHARGRARDKRGAGWDRVSMVHVIDPSAGNELDSEQLLAVNRAIERLAELDPRQAQVVELRFFGGLTVAETAEVVGVSSRTVEGDWTHARFWLRRELSGDSD